MKVWVFISVWWIVEEIVNRLLWIGIVVGEFFGDILGEGFIKVICVCYLDVEFVGIGGLKMNVFGC